MIFTDGVHVVSDATLDELHSFADKAGLSRKWFQDSPKHPHYDVTTERMKKKVVKLGAALVSPVQVILKAQQCASK
jgi:hypothetical protein